MLVFRGALGSERDAVVGRQVFIEPMLVARLVKRSDGTPHREAAVQAIDVQSGAVLSSGVTDQDGRVQLAWKPGRTVLFIPAVNLFPMYWAGASAFSSSIEGGRIVQTTDLDAQRQVTIPIPLILAAWPERTEACTEQPLFSHQPHGFFQQSGSAGRRVGGPRASDLRSEPHHVHPGATMGGTLSSVGRTQCPGVWTRAPASSPRMSTGLARWWGASCAICLPGTSGRSSMKEAVEPVGQPTCDTEYSEVEVIPVTVAEE